MFSSLKKLLCLLHNHSIGNYLGKWTVHSALQSVSIWQGWRGGKVGRAQTHSIMCVMAIHIKNYILL